MHSIYDIQDVLGFISAAQQITRVGNCACSPVVMQVTEQRADTLELELSFTIYSMHTDPIYDVLERFEISRGVRKARYIDFEMARAGTDAGRAERKAAYWSNVIQIKRACHRAMYRELFGAPRNFFHRNFYIYRHQITAHPVGDVSLTLPFSLPRALPYRLDLPTCAAILRLLYPAASVLLFKSCISVAF